MVDSGDVRLTHSRLPIIAAKRLRGDDDGNAQYQHASFDRSRQSALLPAATVQLAVFLQCVSSPHARPLTQTSQFQLHANGKARRTQTMVNTY